MGDQLELVSQPSIAHPWRVNSTLFPRPLGSHLLSRPFSVLAFSHEKEKAVEEPAREE